MSRQFVAFDLETTGLVAQIDRVVEIGAVRFTEEGREVGRFEHLVNPERPMSPAAEAIHGISDADLEDAPPAREVLPRFLEFLDVPGTTSLVAHNATFDAGFLGRELCRAGMRVPDHRVFDTLALSRRSHPELSSHRLSVLAGVFGLDPQASHRALADSLRVKQLWLTLGGPSAPLERLVSYPIHDPQENTPAPHGWGTLGQAVALGWDVRIEYEGGSRGSTPRAITPRRFLQKGGMTYLVAYCHLDAFEKSFRLDRIRHCEVVHAGIPADRHVDHRAGNR
jgi:DNA polymerase III subunit epsilon